MLQSSAAGFQVGDKVQRRDGTEAWAVGFVTQLEPLKVNMSDSDPSESGYSWSEVRPLEAAGAQQPASAPERPPLVAPQDDEFAILEAMLDDG